MSQPHSSVLCMHGIGNCVLGFLVGSVRVGASALLLHLALGRFLQLCFLERPLCCRSAAAEVLRYITPMRILMLWLCP